jgi:hypothetical protein
VLVPAAQSHGRHALLSAPSRGSGAV